MKVDTTAPKDDKATTDLTKASDDLASQHKKDEAAAKRFLWMPRKYGIPVAIAGVALLAFGAYKFFTAKKG